MKNYVKIFFIYSLILNSVMATEKKINPAIVKYIASAAYTSEEHFKRGTQFIDIGNQFAHEDMFDTAIDNYQRGIEHYRHAHSQEHPQAQHCLKSLKTVFSITGSRYYEKEKKSDIAIKYFIIAADLGDVIAQYNLGCCYEGGDGVKKDETLAAKYFWLAADQGDKNAQFNIGIRYHTGDGVKKDETLAAKYFRLAADQGDKDAQFNFAALCTNGIDGIKDYTSAATYYKLAAGQGHLQAQAWLRIIEKQGFFNTLR